MQISLKTVLIVAGVLLVAMLGLAGLLAIKKNAYEARIVELQNQVASRDQTIETQKGVYERLALQSQNLTELLGTKDHELALLKQRLDEQGAQILTANTVIAKLKADLKSAGEVPVTHPDPTDPGMARVDFDTRQDLDPFRVIGFTTFDCGEDTKANYGVTLSQERPLKFSVVASQDKDGQWRTSVTSSEKAFQVDIALAAVNPYMLEPKWYEKISLSLDLGISTNPGLLGGVGAAYQIGKFEVGPKVWITLDRGVSPYFGASLIWHPFQR